MSVVLCQFLICHLGPPSPAPSIMLYIACCSDCATRMLHLSKPVRHSLCPNKVKVLKLTLLNIIVATSSGLILQICQSMAPSLHCKLLRFGLVKGQVSQARSMSFCTQKLYTRNVLPFLVLKNLCYRQIWYSLELPIIVAIAGNAYSLSSNHNAADVISRHI